MAVVTRINFDLDGDGQIEVANIPNASDDGVITLTSAGPPVSTPADGTIVVDNTNDVFYFRSGGAWFNLGATGGEINTASNRAGDEGIFGAKVGVDLEFKSLTAGTDISLSSDANSITINSTASSGEDYFDAMSVGTLPSASGTDSIAIGPSATASALGTVQFLSGTNSTASTMQFLTNTIANSDGIKAPATAAPPASTPTDGSLYVDSGADVFFFRSGGAWLPVEGGATVGIVAEDEGTPVAGGPHTTVDFVGAGVVATDGGSGTLTVTIAGGGSGITIEDEGTGIGGGPHTILDFVGAGVTATDAGSGEATITIAGGGGSSYLVENYDGSVPTLGTGTDNVVLGEGASITSGDDCVVIGKDSSVAATANSDRNVVIGFNSTITGSSEVGCVVIGDSASAAGTAGIAIGDGATTTTNADSIAIGTNGSATGTRSTALGHDCTAVGTGAVAIGDAADAGTGSVAIGDAADASASDAISIGCNTINTGASEVVAVGAQITVGVGSSRAVLLGRGTSSGINDSDGIAIGPDAGYDADFAMAIGHDASSTGISAVALGDTAVASATDAMQLGTGTNATASTLQFLSNTIANSVGVQIPAIAGPPISTPADGTLILDTAGGTNGVLYIRSNGAWHAAVTF